MSFTENNHYVPQWYQKRFFPPGLKEQKFYYLDLNPERVNHPDGRFHFREACRRLGPLNCFSQNNLYTLFFAETAADVIEKRFFGNIDRLGVGAVDFFSKYTVSSESGAALRNIIRYLDAQKLRTPKGIDFIKKLTKEGSNQQALIVMGKLWQVHATIWTEGVWEILHCDDTETKFIVTDHPVTTYNKELFPLSKECRYPFDAPIEFIGTHTIFPLDLNSCLVVTNLEYVRNPWVNPLRVRENPRYFAETIFDIRKVQTGRQIPESDVRAINYILKKRARRYIAAAKEEWLYPDEHMKTTMWNKLGNRRFFLLPDPRKISFTTGIYVGNKDGSSWGIDEYGRHPNDHDLKVKEKRRLEFETFHKAKQAWDEHFGKLSSENMIKYF